MLHSERLANSLKYDILPEGHQSTALPKKKKKTSETDIEANVAVVNTFSLQKKKT